MSSSTWVRSVESSARSDAVLMASQPAGDSNAGQFGRCRDRSRVRSVCFPCSRVSTFAASTATSRPRSASARTGAPATSRSTAVREIVADVRARGDAALRELTERFDGCRDRRAAGPARRRAGPRSRRRRPSCGPRSSTPPARSPAYHEAQRPAPVDPRARRGAPARARRPRRAGRALRARWARRLPVDRAHDRDPGPRRRGGRARPVRPARPRRRRCPPRRSPRPRWPASTRCTGSAVPRRSPRWRTAPRRSGAVDVDRRSRQRLRGAGEA